VNRNRLLLLAGAVGVAAALAVVLMVISFAMLYVINWLETWSSRFQN